MTNNKNNENEKRGLVTCVRLSKKTRDSLAKMGDKTQTFDDVVTGLITKSKKPCVEVEAGENENE